jgi:hypothetical protein
VTSKSQKRSKSDSARVKGKNRRRHHDSAQSFSRCHDTSSERSERSFSAQSEKKIPIYRSFSAPSSPIFSRQIERGMSAKYNKPSFSAHFRHQWSYPNILCSRTLQPATPFHLTLLAATSFSLDFIAAKGAEQSATW